MSAEPPTSWRDRLRPDGLPRGEHAWLAWFSLALVPVLAVVIHLLIGLRPEHFAFFAVVLGFSWWGPRLRGLIRASGPFILTGMGYDFLRLAMPWRAEIHIADLWRAEQTLFGGSGNALGLTDWIATHTHPVGDAYFGLCYVLYLILPVAIASYLYVKHDAEDAITMGCTFAAMSIIGWFIWLAWPAAPPWYVDRHGLGPVVLDAAPSAAGGARFDDLFGVNMFRKFYERSWNVFGAMPSLHVAYGMLPLIGTWKLGWRARVPAAVWGLSMWYASVYLRHHYILDGLVGIVVALAGYAAFAGLKRGVSAIQTRGESGGRDRTTPPGIGSALPQELQK